MDKENKSDKESKEEISKLQSDDKAVNRLSRHERFKRRRSVRNAKLLFRAIDVLFKLSQNTCPYVNRTNADTIECDADIVYDDAVGGVCKLDYYRVKSDEKQPAILLIHGGGFCAGDKKYRKGRAQFFALNGFSVFCINYGLAPDYTFPTPLKHIVTAANYVYDNADRFNIDVSRIFVDGDSAGGYYAAMLAAFAGNDVLKTALDCDLKFNIFGAMFNCGVYDMNTVLNTKYPFDLADGVVLSLTGIRCKDFDEYEHKDVCEPVNFVTEHFPPTFIIYSDYDTFCKGQGQVMIDKLNKNGVYCEYYSARHATSNHCFSLTWSGEDASAANELMLSFAKRLAAGKIKLN